MSSAAINNSKSCCPSYWDDQRKWEDSEKLTGAVTHRSGDIYGRILGVDSNKAINKKMAILFASQPFIGIGRIIVRIGHILSAQWAWGQGYQEALKSWKAKRRICALNNTPNKAPGKMNLYTKVALHSLYRLSEAFLKLITMPIATLFCMISSAITVVDPLLSRRLYALTEETWSVNLGEWNLWHQITNYIAPCMQPTRVGEKMNLYRGYPNYDSNTIRSQAVLLSNLLKNNRDYLSNEDFDLLMDGILKLRKEIKKISSNDQDEIWTVNAQTNRENPTEEWKLLTSRRKFLDELIKTFKSYMEKLDQAADQKIDRQSGFDLQIEADAILVKLRTDIRTTAEWVR